MKIKQAAWMLDKNLFERSELFLSVEGDCVEFSDLLLNSLDFFGSFLGQAKNERDLAVVNK